MRSRLYHFNLGNSDDGPLGLCANVEANSPEEALKELKYRLEWIYLQPEGYLLPVMKLNDLGEYINVYVNTDAITVADIDDSGEVP